MSVRAISIASYLVFVVCMAYLLASTADATNRVVFAVGILAGVVGLVSVLRRAQT